MKKDKRFSLALQRSMAALLLTFLFFSCQEDDLEFDCPQWELNIGDECSDGTDINGNITTSGYLDTECNCISDSIWVEDPDTTDNDSINSPEYDCPGLMQNFNDSCWVSSGGSTYLGVVTSDCECDAYIPNDYDCADLMLNIGDTCSVQTALGTYYGSVNSNCECEVNNLPQFDCPDIMMNYGDSCWTISADSTYVTGIIDSNCSCN